MNRHPCPICGAMIPANTVACSQTCVAKIDCTRCGVKSERGDNKFIVGIGGANRTWCQGCHDKEGHLFPPISSVQLFPMTEQRLADLEAKVEELQRIVSLHLCHQV